MKYYITGGLCEVLAKKYGNCDSLEECDVFINCKHDGYQPVVLLYKTAEMDNRIINIRYNSPGQDFDGRTDVVKFYVNHDDLWSEHRETFMSYLEDSYRVRQLS